MIARSLPLNGLAGRKLIQQAAKTLPRVVLAPRQNNVAMQSRYLSISPIRWREEATPSQTPLGKVEPKLSLTFTCAVIDCGHRSSHEFTRRSYEKGIVIVQCPACKNRHLIADHLSWFTETPSDPKTIEQIIASKGGKVQRGANYIDGQGYETMEIYKDDK